MEEDAKLIRAIMLEAGKVDLRSPIYDGQLQIEDYTPDQIIDHVNILINEGLVIGVVQWADDAPFGYVITGLTPRGHKLLKVFRSDTGWNKFLGYVERGGEFALKIAIETVIQMGTKGLLS